MPVGTAQVRLKPGLSRLWRDPGSIQLGLSSRSGAVLDGVTAADVSVLEALRHGVDRDRTGDPRARQLLRLLSDAGLLVERPTDRASLAQLGDGVARLAPDATVWSLARNTAGDGWAVVGARAGRHVTVHGAGRLGAVLATTLASAGVGLVTAVDDRPTDAGDVAPAGARPSDVGMPRADATELAVLRAGGNQGHGSRPGRADVAVLVDHGAADAARADSLVRADVPHLSVVVRDVDVVVGPLVRPGTGPCLRCLDLHRTDRDPSWPRLLAQLLEPRDHAEQAEETAVSVLAAGLAALQVLGVLDGAVAPATVGATLEIELPDGLVGRREWPVHHRCGCGWPGRRSRGGPSPSAGGRTPSRGE